MKNKKKSMRVTFHDLRRAIMKSVSKGMRIQSTGVINNYCSDGLRSQDHDYHTPIAGWKNEGDLIKVLIEDLEWDNFEVLKILPIVRKRKAYFDYKAKRVMGIVRVDRKKNNVDWFDISPGGTKKKYNVVFRERRAWAI